MPTQTLPAFFNGFLLLNAPIAIAGNCYELETATPRELLDYLKIDRNVPGCVELAIDRLGSLKDPAAIDALIKHLDFLRVEARGEIVMSSFHDYEWPAATALSAIGPQALPALEKVLQEVLISGETFRNALFAFVSINRDNLKELSFFLSARISRRRTSRFATGSSGPTRMKFMSVKRSISPNVWLS